MCWSACSGVRIGGDATIAPPHPSDTFACQGFGGVFSVKIITSLAAAGLAVLLLATGVIRPAALLAQTDLDALMKDVVARRDDNWKKLQQYILNEHEQIEVRGPGQLPVWGERRDYQWFLRDGFFVRSPLRVNGVTIGEDERRKYEGNFLRRERARDKRLQAREKATAGETGAPAPTTDVPTNVDSLIAQTREPQFVSSAYFLRFKFEQGKYALVGKEAIDGRDLLKVEYYPARLFSDDTDRNKKRAARGEKLSKDQQVDQTMEQAMNKVSMVTLWVEPKAHQIVKYVFNNVNMDFLPGAAFVRLGDLKATMVMSQPFKGTKATMPGSEEVWLPKNIEMYVSMMIAVGGFDMRYSITYNDYRLAETSSRIK